MSLTGFLTILLTRSYEFVYRWGYLGLFIINFLETMTLSLFPLPTLFFVFTFGGILNPFLVAIVSGLGGTVGAIFVYVFGRGFKDIAEKKYSKQLEKTKDKFHKYKGFWWIVIVNLTPLPDGLISIFCGMIRYDLKKFLIATFCSKIIYNLILAYAGYYSVTWVLNLVKFNLPLLI